MKRNGCQWHFDQAILVIAGVPVKLKHRPSRANVRRIYVREAVSVPANSQANVPVRMPFSSLRTPASEWVTEAKELRPGLFMGRTVLSNDDTYATMQFVNLTDKCHKLDCGLFLGTAEPGVVLGPDADTVDPRTTADEVNGPVLAGQQPATRCGNVVGQPSMENSGQQSVARLEGSQGPEVASRHEPTPSEPALFTCDSTEPITTCADHSLFSSHSHLGWSSRAMRLEGLGLIRTSP